MRPRPVPPNNAEPCSGALYAPGEDGYWFQSRSELTKSERKSGNWYNAHYTNGSYFPNEYDGTCGDSARFGFTISETDGKMESYPFIAALGIEKCSTTILIKLLLNKGTGNSYTAFNNY